MKVFLILISLSVLSVASVYSASTEQDPGTTISPSENEVEFNETVLVAKAKKEAYNMKLVQAALQEVFGDKNFDAVDKYFHVNYIQHNPDIADGNEALRSAAKVLLKGLPPIKIEVLRMGAEGDLVYMHWKSTQLFGGKVASVMDILRVDGDKLVEHWDIIQFLPEKSISKHPLF